MVKFLTTCMLFPNTNTEFDQSYNIYRKMQNVWETRSK